MNNSSVEYARVSLGRICVIALTRNGGVSRAPYQSLNLGSHVGDKPENVLANFEIVRRYLNAEGLTYLQANHGTTVNLATSFGEAPSGDGLITKTPKHAIVALSADCVPVALIDPVNEVIEIGRAHV